MESKTKVNLIKGTLVAGALLSISSLSATPTTSLFNYSALGSGAEVRTELLRTGFDGANTFEAKCGEKETKPEKAPKEAKSKEKTKKAESKKTEAKCGEGKCGEKATETKEKSESKTKEAKCGEGKCGN